MQKFNQAKNQKVIISFITIIFIFSIFYFTFLFNVNTSRATVVADPYQQNIQTMMYFGAEREVIETRIWDEIKAIFFKNVLGNLANLIAQQSAIYVASGGEGEAPLFITNFEEFINDYAEAQITDFVATVIENLTGINICTLDPSIAIDLTLDMPPMPGWTGYEPTCTWEALQSHWQEIGQKSLSDFISVDYGIGIGGEFSKNKKKLADVISTDKSLMIWDKKLNTHCFNCSPRSGRESVEVKCPDNAIYNKLVEKAGELQDLTKQLESDVNVMLANALSDKSATMSVGSFRIVPENIPLIKNAWLDLLNPKIEELNKIVSAFSACKSKSATDLGRNPGNCQAVLNDLSVTPPPSAQLVGSKLAEDLARAFEREFGQKIGYVGSLSSSINSGIEFLKGQVTKQFNPEFFEGSAAYNAALAKDLFNPEANEFNAYDTLSQEIANIGFSEFLNRNLQATIDRGWKSVTDKIGKTIRTPASMISKKSVDDIVESKGTAREYTRSVAADAMGVFLETLYNQLIQRLLENLIGGEQEAASRASLTKEQDTSLFDIYNPF